MLRSRKIGLALVLAVLAFGTVGCGEESFTAGFGTLTVTSVAPVPIPALIPTAVTITGGDFDNAVGTTVQVTWIASTGTPFLGGTSAEVTLPGTITSPTTIATTSPLVVICGPVSITASVRVTMPSGLFGQSTSAIATFVAPTVTTFVGGGAFPAAIPQPFVLNGTNMGPVGSPVTIHWRSTGGGPPPIFHNGTSTTVSTPGVVASATTITGVSPEATVCGPAFEPAEVFRVDFQDGSCTPTGGPFPPAQFNAPTIVVNGIANAGTSGLAGSNDFFAAIPEPFTITGDGLGANTGYGPTGGIAQVTFTAVAGTPFSGGTSATISVPGTIVNDTTVTGVSPPAVVCGVASVTANVRVTVPNGSCTPVLRPVDFLAPTFASITNQQGTGVTPATPYFGSNDFAAAIPEVFRVTGTGFGPIGGTAFVRWDLSAGGSTPFEGGTTAVTLVPGMIVNATTIEGVSPTGAMCGAILSTGVQIGVGLPGGSCTLLSPATAADYFTPTINAGAIANVDRGGAIFLSAIPETFTLSGTDFGPIGGTATVRFTSTSAGTAATPFAGGTSAFADVLCTITSRTSVTGVSPTALLCPVPGTDPQTGLNVNVDLHITLEGGSCNVADLAQANLIQGPTIADIRTPPAAPAGAPPTNVPSTLVLGAATAPDFRITGTGFAPLGAIALVTFEDFNAPLTAMNGGATITVPALIVSETAIEGRFPLITTPRLTASEAVRVTVALAPNGSCAYFDNLVNFVAPPLITAVTNISSNGGNGIMAAGFVQPDLFAGFSSLVRVTGTGFEPGACDVVLYSTVQGVNAATQAPIRPLGTGNPAAGTFGHTDLGGIAGASTATIQDGFHRVEQLAPDLDTDNDGLVPYTVRCVNSDGQFAELQAGNVRLQSATTNLGGSANARNNNDCALDPTSFTDDFVAGGGTVDGTDGVNIVVVSGDDPLAGIGPVFSSTDAFQAVSTDGGRTFATGAMGVPGNAVGGVPAGALINFVQVEFDAFGNLGRSFLMDDFVGGTSAVHVDVSADQGVTYIAGLIRNGGPGSAGLLGAPDLASGVESTGGTQFALSWIAGTGSFFLAQDAPIADSVQMTALGVAGASSPGWIVNFGAPAALFGLIDAECAVGANGEVYVAWQEPQFLAPPFTQRIFVDQDQDGNLAGIYDYTDPDVIVVDEDIPGGFGLPAAPDTGPFIPSLSMAVVQAGTHAGRVLLAHENVVPAIGPSPDHAQIVVRYSDDNGANWSFPSVPHPITNADRFIPEIASDPITGRLYCTWYDTTSSVTTGNTTFERFSAASADGVTWSANRNLSGARGASTHAANFDTDFGTFAGLCAFNGCVVATWNDTVDGNVTADPIVVMYEQK